MLKVFADGEHVAQDAVLHAGWRCYGGDALQEFVVFEELVLFGYEGVHGGG